MPPKILKALSRLRGRGDTKDGKKARSAEDHGSKADAVLSPASSATSATGTVF